MLNDPYVPNHYIIISSFNSTINSIKFEAMVWILIFYFFEAINKYKIYIDHSKFYIIDYKFLVD